MKLLYPTRNPHITQEYGNKTSMYLSFHKGTDFRVWNDPERQILASANGTVIHVDISGEDWFILSGGRWIRSNNYKKGSSFGNHVIIDHNGYYTLYGHLENVHVKKGDHVKAGHILGKGGNTGYSQGAHLHFELRNGGNSSRNAINAKPYFVSSVESEIPKWGEEAWNWGQKNGVLSDKSSFDDTLTKGELMVLLKRYDEVKK